MGKTTYTRALPAGEAPVSDVGFVCSTALERVPDEWVVEVYEIHVRQPDGSWLEVERGLMSEWDASPFMTSGVSVHDTSVTRAEEE